MKPGIVLTSLFAIVALAVQPALARAPEPSEVTIDNYHSENEVLYFPGHVESSKKCEKDRKVTIYAFGGSDPDGKIGSDETNSKGKFKVTKPLPVNGEQAYAAVKKSSPGAVNCGSDESPPVNLSG